MQLQLYCAHWGNYENSTATVLWQKFRQINSLLWNSTLNWFDEKNCVVVNLPFFHIIAAI